MNQFIPPLTDFPGGSEAVDFSQYDSTDNSEDEELNMPPVAAGNDLRFMKRALEVALQSEDPHTKVSTNYIVLYYAGF